MIVAVLNDYQFAVLTSVIMKCLDNIIISHIKCNIPAMLDPLQFSCCFTRSVNDTILLALHTVLVRLKKKNTCQNVVY